MERITRAKLDMAFEAYVRTLKGAGVDCEGLYMVIGSVRNGQSWAVRYDSGKRAVGTDFGGHIGSTSREAFNTLHLIIRTVLDLGWSGESE